MSSPWGSSVSLCQTISVSNPAARKATARSRSQLEPGKTSTAAFMGSGPPGFSWRSGSEIGDDGYAGRGRRVETAKLDQGIRQPHAPRDHRRQVEACGRKEIEQRRVAMGGHAQRAINGKLPAIDRVPWQRHLD